MNCSFTEEDFTIEEFPEEFMPPPMRDDFVIRDEMPQNNLIQDKGMHFFFIVLYILTTIKTQQ